MDADEMAKVCAPSTNTDHWYTRPWRDTVDEVLLHVVVYASASSFNVSALVNSTDVAPEMDTTGALAVFTTSGRLALAHAGSVVGSVLLPKKLHSVKVTVLTVPGRRILGGRMVGSPNFLFSFRYSVARAAAVTAASDAPGAASATVT